MRNSRSVFLRFLVLIMLAAGPWLLASCRVGSDDLESWSLPPDFTEHQDELATLWLPSKVTRFDWLADDIRHLTATRSAGRVVRGFPKHLQSLDLSYGEVSFLAGLPDGLQELDIRFTNLTKVPPDLPEGITHLALGGKVITSKGIPLNLRELVLEEAPQLANLHELPRSLESLTLVGTSFTDLRGLPPNLRSLTLRWTGVKALVDVPDSVRTLVLDRNPHLRIGNDLPPFLTTLVIQGSPVPDLSRLNYLIELELGAWNRLKPLPGTLRTLRLEGSGDMLQDARNLPSLRTLGVLRGRLEDASLLPLHLERLELQGSTLPDLGDVPAQWSSLRQLDLSWTDLTRLPRLPSGLVWLDLSATHIGDPPPKAGGSARPASKDVDACAPNAVDLSGLPGSLTSLNFRRSMATELKGLPESLETLDVSDSRCLRRLTGALPKLSSLNLRGTAIAVLGELPPNVKVLDISETDVTSLEGIPQDLEDLTISWDQVKAFTNLPPNVHALRFLEPLDPDKIDP